jgi:hypothetical protein
MGEEGEVVVLDATLLYPRLSCIYERGNMLLVTGVWTSPYFCLHRVCCEAERSECHSWRRSDWFGLHTLQKMQPYITFMSCT